jgi:putative membrane protein
MNGKLITTLAAALCFGAVALAAQKDTATAPGSRDEHFVKEAATGGMAEVELGRLAEQKAGSERVKSFGRKMVADHSAANDQLKALAARKQIGVDDGLNREQKATLSRLEGLSGAAFDRAYVADMVRDHEKDVEAFRRESTSGQDPDVRAFAGKTLPTLEEHLRMVRDLSHEVGTSTGN